MRMKYIVLAASAAVVSMVSFPVLADHHGKEKHGGKMFEKADANGDGVVSKEEFMAAQEKMFAKLDSDGDGSLTKEEMKEHRKSMKEKWKAMKEKKKEVEAAE